MNVKEIFDKATSENKALTWEEFNKLATESKAKFTDLAEGKYVDRQKYEDDLAKKDVEISTLNETITSRTNDMTTLQEQLKNAGNDAGKLEELTTNLTALQSKYDADTKSLQDKLNAQAYEFAVRDFANGQKFSSAAAKRDFERSMLQKNLPMENGSIMGANDYIKAYQKENKDAFVIDTPPTPAADPKPQFAGSATGAKTGGPKMSLSEMMAAKNENPDFVISFDQ